MRKEEQKNDLMLFFFKNIEDMESVLFLVFSAWKKT